MNIKKPINKRVVDKPIFNSQEINNAYADYFIKNNIDFNYSNGVITVTREIVKDEYSLDDLERAYSNCDFDSIY